MPERAWPLAVDERNRIVAAGGWKMLAEQQLPALHAVSRRRKKLCCVDDRFAAAQPAMGVAGLGLPFVHDDAAIEFLIQRAQEENVESVLAHEDCGAVKLHAAQTGVTIEQAQEQMLELAARIAACLRAPQERPSVVEIMQLGDVGTLHKATCAYLDLTGRFSLNGVPGFPQGFQITAALVPFKYVLKQLEIVIGIALGDHGFGRERFVSMPFEIVVIGRTPDEIASALCRPGVQQLLTEYRRFVTPVTLLVPL